MKKVFPMRMVPIPSKHADGTLEPSLAKRRLNFSDGASLGMLALGLYLVFQFWGPLGRFDWATLWFSLGAALIGLAARLQGSILLTSQERKQGRAYSAAAFAIVLLVAAFTHFWRLGDLAPVAYDYEGDLARTILSLGERRYSAIDFNVPKWNTWPTMLQYQTSVIVGIFGASPTSFRSVSAMYGLLSCVALFFLARRLFGVLPALLAGLLLAVNPLHLILARRLYVLAPVEFFLITALFFLVAAKESGRVRDYFLAGLSASLMLHFYHAGKVAAVLFPAWFIYLALVHRDKVSAKGLGAFVVAAIVGSLPLVIHEIRQPGSYLDWILKLQPNKPVGISERLLQLWRAVPGYIDVWGISGTPNLEDGAYRWPVLHSWAALVGLVGITAALLGGLNWGLAMIALVFVLGIVPALPGGNAPHPCARRAIVALPAVLLGAALTFRFIWLALSAMSHWARAAILIPLLVAMTALSGVYAWLQYEIVAHNPVFQCIAGSYDQFVIGRELRNKKFDRVRTEMYFLEHKPQWSFYYPAKVKLEPINGLEDALQAEAGRRLVALGPYMGGAGDFVKTVAPGTGCRMVGWTRLAQGLKTPMLADHFIDSMRYGAVYLMELGDTTALAGFKKWGSPSGPYSLAHLFLDRRPGTLTVRIKIPGVLAALNDGPWSDHIEIKDAFGIQRLRLNQAGDMKFGPKEVEILHRGLNQWDQGRVLATPPMALWDVKVQNGQKWPKNKIEGAWVIQRSILPAINPSYPNVGGRAGLIGPYSLILENKHLQVRSAENLSFGFIGGTGRIWLGGELVFDNRPGQAMEKRVKLAPGKKFALTAELLILPSRFYQHSFAIGVKNEMGAELRPLPWDWALAVGREELAVYHQTAEELPN